MAKDEINPIGAYSRYSRKLTDKIRELGSMSEDARRAECVRMAGPIPPKWEAVVSKEAYPHEVGLNTNNPQGCWLMAARMADNHWEQWVTAAYGEL